MLDKTYIEKALCGYPYHVEVLNCVTSTNSILKEEAKKGKEEFSVLIAASQTMGRGRMGNSFFSPDDSGLYMSVLIKNADNPLLVTTDAAVCVARAVERLSGEKVGIKWVNDIYLSEKKVCGILSEASFGENGFIILGIGINVTMPEGGFPADIKLRAGSVFREKLPFVREKLAVEVLKELYDKPDPKTIFKEYTNRSIMTGKEIEIIKNGTREKAVALGICEDYSLYVEKEDGTKEKLSSGDVHIKMEA